MTFFVRSLRMWLKWVKYFSFGAILHGRTTFFFMLNVSKYLQLLYEKIMYNCDAMSVSLKAEDLAGRLLNMKVLIRTNFE